MPLQIVRNDITRMKVDAIVNAANASLLGGGGVDGAIHRAAGPELLEECRSLGGCPVGGAKRTKGYRLPCKYIIHTVGPRWYGGHFGEAEALASCYRSCLALAVESGCESIAFPLISSGAYGYPKDRALQVAVDTISEFLMKADLEVYLVVFDKTAFQLSEGLRRGIRAYIDQHYVDTHSEDLRRRAFHQTWEEEICAMERMPAPEKAPAPPKSAAPKKAPAPAKSASLWETLGSQKKARSLKEVLGSLDESFSEMLLRKINQSGMTDPQVYRKANIDRRLFSKIRSDPGYKPSKPTALSLAIALELSLEETRELLGKAGFSLSHSSKFDVIVEFFLRQGNYNIFEINEALFEYDQSLLGGG